MGVRHCIPGFALAFAAFIPTFTASAAPYVSAELLADGSMTTDAPDGTIYEAGSIAKFACTLAVLRLADRGVMKLDDPVGRFLPSVEGSPVATVTLRHVLANRSGIEDKMMSAVREDVGSVMAVADSAEAVRRFAGQELEAKPGSNWSYDLINWIIVQAVIENATEKPVAEALKELVLGPAGMKESRMFFGSGDSSFATPVEPSRPLPSFLQCAGGMASTPADILALARFAHDGGLSDASLSLLTKVTTAEQSYTLGGRFRTTSAGRLLSWQAGSNGSYKSLVVYDPATDTGFAAMTASGDPATLDAARDAWLNR